MRVTSSHTLVLVGGGGGVVARACDAWRTLPPTIDFLTSDSATCGLVVVDAPGVCRPPLGRIESGPIQSTHPRAGHRYDLRRLSRARLVLEIGDNA